MGNVSMGLSMSLDGFIAGPSGGPERPLGGGGERMFVGCYGGDTDCGGGAHRRSDEPKKRPSDRVGQAGPTGARGGRIWTERNAAS